MSIESNCGFLMDQLTDGLRRDLTYFADQTEDMAVMESEGHWESDSGSARESITAYSIGDGSYDKNFFNWQFAQESGYYSPIWGNPAVNFLPHVEEVALSSDVGVILTMFVGYGERLELGLPSESAPGHGNEHVHHNPIVPGTIGITAANQAAPFLEAAQQSVGKSLR